MKFFLLLLSLLSSIVVVRLGYLLFPESLTLREEIAMLGLVYIFLYPAVLIPLWIRLKKKYPGI